MSNIIFPPFSLHLLVLALSTPISTAPYKHFNEELMNLKLGKVLNTLLNLTLNFIILIELDPNANI